MIDGVLENDGITHRRERPRKYVFPAVYSYRYFQLDELNFSCFSITTLREIPSIFFYNLLTTTRREGIHRNTGKASIRIIIPMFLYLPSLFSLIFSFFRVSAIGHNFSVHFYVFLQSHCGIFLFSRSLCFASILICHSTPAHTRLVGLSVTYSSLYFGRIFAYRVPF